MGSDSSTLDNWPPPSLSKHGLSRRLFGKFATLVTAGITLPFYNESALAQLSVGQDASPAVVRINANENPLGPCPEAVEAISAAIRKAGRYAFEEALEFAKLQAQLEGLKSDYVRPFAGSSPALHQAVLAFTSPERPLVMADPGYEAAEHAAKVTGANVIKIPLTKDYSHDVRAMVRATPNIGLLYVCNPNNPTGTLTSRSDIEFLLANKPSNAILLLDEAYIQFVGITPMSDLVAANKDVVVLRTFSKLYGMAGLRAGAALARPDLLARITAYSAGTMAVTAMAGATASLKASATVVPKRRKLVTDIRNDVCNWLVSKKLRFVPSVSSKIMIDVRRPGQQVVRAMAREGVLIGRVWPSWPSHVRVSIGTSEDMERFKTAFAKVLGV